MKNLLRIASCLLLASLFIISSCSKDEDGIPKNVIRYNGKNYKLDFAFGINYGSFQEGVTYNNTDFYFIDRVIDPEANDPLFEYGLYLEMFSAGSANFQGGEFSFYDGSGSIPSGSLFTDGGLFFYDDDLEPVFIAGGKIKLTISGDIYTFTFDMIDDDGKKLEGNFSGVIEINNIGEPNISGSITVGDDSRSADFGEIADYGALGGHYNYDFIIYDSDDTYELYFEAFSLGTSAFQTGTFTYGTTGTNYFNVIQYFDYETFDFYEAVSGSVVVTKLSGAREYRLQFNVVLDDASTLVGTVEGNFRYSYEGGRMGRVRQERGSEYFNVNKSSVRRLKK
ncbi:MAG: hypothetical protein KF803_09245 [Cyclobacteriaceae bacterium]|nr:hypothetical protein [Cyclobacteriaceae bacterium]